MKVDYKADFSALSELVDGIREKLETKVGILLGSKARNTQDGDGAKIPTNAELGAVHEFGSITRNIPARSWLRMPIEYRSDDIKNSILKKKELITKNIAKGNIKFLYDQLGLSAEVAIQDSFETSGFGQWKPNNPATIKGKGSSSPLIDSGQLREAVMYKVVKKNG